MELEEDIKVNAPFMIQPAQIRAARALLRWSQDELAQRSGVGAATLKRIEARDDISGTARTLARLESTFRDQGIVFLDRDQTGGAGVRFAE